MRSIVEPAATKNWLKTSMPKLCAKKKPNVPIEKTDIPPRNRNLCLNFMEKALIATPTIRPVRLLISTSSLAVPIEILKDSARSTSKVLRKAVIVNPTKLHNTKVGSSKALFDLLAPFGSQLIKFF
jgi:hypothetical protein